jgi:uncharacterized SAM-binding protein YcdF (DUF218 family)
MLIFKNLLTQLLLPPGIFISILIITGAWFLYKKKRNTGIVTLIFGCFMWALSISPVADSLIRGLESQYGIPKKVQGDVIILLGHGIFDEAPDLTGLGAPSGIYLTRMVTAVRLQKRLNIPIIVSGAEVPDDKVIKDHIVKRFFIDLGVPAEQIIIEDKSRDTFENAMFTQKICARSGFKNPILVTSAYHLKRAVMSFEKVGLKVLPFPAGFKSWQGKQYHWNAYLPGNFLTASTAIKEYLGLVFYKFVY